MIRADEWFDLPRGSADRQIFAIGDTHGYARQFAALLAFIRRDAEPGALVVYTGDYMDRGPECRETLRLLVDGVGRPDVEEIALRGNHDQYMLDALAQDAATRESWLRYGGRETLRSFDIDCRLSGGDLAEAIDGALGNRQRAFLEATPLRHDRGELTFVHAGLNPLRPFDDQDPEDLIWIRHAFLNCPPADWPFDNLVIHGHSPFAFGVDHHRICIDSHCYESGVLTALELRGRRGRFHQTAGG